ncbi:TPA: hypothetical protein P0E34_004259 [Vibrio campbellii]|nr:hypothetical protein [Vibrio campbellii]
MHKVVETYILNNNLKNEAEVWPLIKCQMYRHVRLSKNVDDMEYKSTSYLPLFLALLLSVFNILRTKFNKKEAAYFGAFSRVSIQKGQLHDEFVSQEKQKKMCTLYHCSNFEGVELSACFKRGVIFENLIVKLLGLIIKRGGWFPQPPVLSERFFELLSQEYDVSKEKIQGILLDYECKKAAYKKLIQWLGVVRVEVVSAYTKPAIVSAANGLGIETLEYQHGLLAPYHPSYHYTGDKLWRSSMLPNRLKLYSSFWQMKMREANFVKEDAIEVEGGLSPVHHDAKKQVFSKVGSEKFFLFTGQGLCYSEVSTFIIDLIAKYPDYTVVYRPHPREHQNHEQLSLKINNDRFIVIDRETHQDTLTLIGASRAHFSIFSSCHFEAIELLGKTYVLDIIEHNLMKEGGEDENIIFITNASQIMDI